MKQQPEEDPFISTYWAPNTRRPIEPDRSQCMPVFEALERRLLRSAAPATIDGAALAESTQPGAATISAMTSNLDLAVTKSNGTASVTSNNTVAYQITVVNHGPDDAMAATVQDHAPRQLTDLVWTAQVIGTGTATLAGIGPLHESFDLASGSSIIYSIEGFLAGSGFADSLPHGTVTNWVKVDEGPGAVDSNPANNQASDSDLWGFAFGGTGHFVLAEASLGTYATNDLVLGDLDGDGDLDVFAANIGPNRVWTNNGHGTFLETTQELGNYNSNHAALGDLDGDGDLDAFVANGSNQPNHVWLNTGDGIFHASPQVLPNDTSSTVALGDMDGDGDLDVFLANDDSDRLLLNDGYAEFTDATAILSNSHSTHGVIGDVDGDGDLDLLVTTLNAAANIWHQQDDGTFRVSSQTIGDGSNFAVALGDVDGDGDLDAFLGGIAEGHQVWANDGTGYFYDSDQRLGNNASLSFEILLGDVDSDGDLDAVVADAHASELDDQIWINDGNGFFTDQGASLGADRTHGIGLGDLDRDGDLDIVTANVGDGTNQVWVNADSRISVTKTSKVTAVASGENLAYEIVVKNHAATEAEITVTDTASDWLYFGDWTATVVGTASARTSGSGVIAEIIKLGPSSSITYAAEARVAGPLPSNHPAGGILTNRVIVHSLRGGLDDDFSDNTAHDSDIVLPSASRGSISFIERDTNFIPQGATGSALGDLDGDGDLDLFMTTEASNQVWINTGYAHWVDSMQTLGDHTSRDVALADLDADGDLDAFVVNGDDQPNHVWRNDGAGIFTRNDQALANRSSHGVALGDIDGDGDVDAFVANAMGADPRNRLWLNDGDGFFSDSGFDFDEDRSEAAALGDLDGDGDLDIFVANFGGNRVWRNEGSDGFVEMGTPLGGSSSLAVTLADFDDDGDLDAVVANDTPESSLLWVNDGLGNFSTTPAWNSLAKGTDLGVGDLNGDGTTDLVLIGPEANFTIITTPYKSFINLGETLGNGTSIEIGDLDGDDDLDALIVNFTDGIVTTWTNADTDLTITTHSQTTSVTQGEQITYTIEVTNNGQLDVSDAFVRDNPSRSVSQIRWTAELIGGGTAELSGFGQINEWIDLAPGSRLTYTVEGTVDGYGAMHGAAESFVTNVATIYPPLTLDDSTPWNNRAHDSNRVMQRAVGGTGTFADVGETLDVTSIASFELGDLNGDGTLDAVVFSRAAEIGGQIWFNNGRGQFHDAGFTLGSNPVHDIALADLNGDGSLDIVVVRPDQADRIWLNDGLGNFSRSTQVLAGPSSTGVKVGDLDGDGSMDLFVVQYRGNHRIWLNDGTGKFTLVQLKLGRGGRDAALGDLDGDGDLDIFLAYYHPTGNRVWINLGSGQFQDSGQVLGNQRCGAIDLADVDDDGDLDAFVGTFASLDTSNRIWLNDGAGNFTDSGQALGEGLSVDVALGDLNGDGAPDALVSTSLTSNPVWINDGAGNFTNPYTLPSSTGFQRELALGDVDADGDLDVLVGVDGGGVQVLHNVGVNLGISKSSLPTMITRGEMVDYTIVVANPGGIPIHGARVRDIPPNLLTNIAWNTTVFGTATIPANGIGPIDLEFDLHQDSTVLINVTATVSSNMAHAAADAILTNIAVVELPAPLRDSDPTDNIAHESDGLRMPTVGGTGTFVPAIVGGDTDTGRDVALGDLDGDGDLDAYVAGEGKDRVWLNLGNHFMTPEGDDPVPGDARAVALGDLDGDGDLDAFVAGVGTNRVRLNRGDGVFSDSGQMLGDGFSTDVALGDLDGDGDLDAFVTNFSDASRLWLNDGQGRFTANMYVFGNAPSTGVALGDIDHDGDLDAVMSNFGEANRYFINLGDGSFVTSTGEFDASYSVAVALEDLDGDGNLDVFVANQFEPDRVWRNISTGFFIDTGQSLGNDNSSDVRLGDLDGDGDIDAYVTNALGPNRVWFNDGFGIFDAGSQDLGSHRSSGVAIADLDADGDLDAFVANMDESDNLWINNNPPAMAPQVTAVVVSGRNWTPQFLARLAEENRGVGGFEIPAGSANQLNGIPWSDVDQVTIRFSQEVLVGHEDLTIASGAGHTHEMDNFATGIGPTGQFQAQWTLRNPIHNDTVRLQLNGTSSTGVRNRYGVLLDGEWTDSASAFPSGNGMAGGNFQFLLTVLAGDLNGNCTVDGGDLSALLSDWLQPVSKTDTRHDINNDGRIDGGDIALVLGQWLHEAPTAPPLFASATPAFLAPLLIAGSPTTTTSSRINEPHRPWASLEPLPSEQPFARNLTSWHPQHLASLVDRQLSEDSEIWGL